MHVRSCWDDAHFSLNDQYLLDSRNGMCQKLIAVKSEIYTRCVNPQVHYVYFPFSKNISNHKVIHIQTRSHIRTHTHTHRHTHTQTLIKAFIIHHIPTILQPTPIVYQISHEDVKILTCLPLLPLKKPG